MPFGVLAPGTPAAAVEPPPEGWNVSDKVYFTGESKTVKDGDELVYGQIGEVVGPAKSGEDSETCMRVEFTFAQRPGTCRVRTTQVRPPVLSTHFCSLRHTFHARRLQLHCPPLQCCQCCCARP